MKGACFVLVDISNTFTKISLATRTRIGPPKRIPTRDLSQAALQKALGKYIGLDAVVASVVPKKNAVMAKTLKAPICWVGPKIDLGIGIDYPKPASIGADRLANAVAACSLYGAPAIVVDFGTAVTFDVITAEGNYAGGVIAPGLHAMTDYLHERTALLPRVTLREPREAIGRSTKAAMLSGAVYGYRGLILEIIHQICEEIGTRKNLHVLATGGDARLIAGQTKIFTAVSPTLTLEGLRIIATRNFPDGK
jgi:type III pantothenate kinase